MPPIDEIVLRGSELEASFAVGGQVAIISGPSGSGKSYLIERICADPRSGWSGTADVRRTDPISFALHAALGESLRDGLERPEDVARLGARLRAAIETLAVGVPREVAAIGIGRLLAVLSGGLAPDVKASVEALSQEIRASGPEALAASIEKSGGVSPLDGFLALANEVSEFAGGSPVTVCLDRGELMSEDSINLLLDLAEVELGALRIVVAVKSSAPRGAASLARFAEQELIAGPVKLEPLSAKRVAELVPGTTRAAAEQLLSRGAQPIELVDALKGADGPDAAISWEESVVDRVRAATPREQAAVFEFAVFSERPDERTLARLAGGQVAVWEKEEMLGRLGLITSSGGAPWLHERHRAAIVEAFAEELREPAMRGLRLLGERVSEVDYLLPEVLELSYLADRELTGEPAAVAELSSDALGVYGAFLELAAPEQTQLAVSTVVSYGRAQWGVEDGTGGVAMLLDLGLLAQDEDDPGLLVLEASDQLTFALVRARLLENFGRAPVPSLADMLVRHGFAEQLRDALGVVSRIGPVSLGALARLEAGLREGREDAPSLIVAAEFRGAPLGVAARFGDDAARERALEEISGQVIPVFGKWLSVGRPSRAPFGVQPAKRWSIAAEALGAELGAEPTAAEGTELGHEAIAERLRLLTRLAQGMLPEELQAAGLDQPLALGFVTNGRYSFEIELRGGRAGIVDISTLRPELPRGPRVMLQAEVKIPRVDEQVGAMRFTLGGPEREVPAWAAIERIESEIARFNEGQPPLSLPGAQFSLLERLTPAHNERSRDTELLCRLVPGVDPDRLGSIDFHLCLSSGGCGPEDDAFAVWSRSDRDHQTTRIHFDVPPFFEAPDYEQLLAPVGLDFRDLVRVRTGSVSELLAVVLGHDVADIELSEPITPG